MVSTHLTLYGLELVVNIWKRFKNQAREIFSSQVHGEIWVVLQQFVVLSFSAVFSTLSSQVYTENNVEDHFLFLGCVSPPGRHSLCPQFSQKSNVGIMLLSDLYINVAWKPLAVLTVFMLA